MSLELVATSWTHSGPWQPVDGVSVSVHGLRQRAEAVAAAGFAGIGFTVEDLLAGRDELSWPDLRLLCDDLGLVHTEVELLTDWWSSGALRSRSDRQRRILLEAAEILGARQVKIAGDVWIGATGIPAQLVEVRAWAAELHALAAEADAVGTRVALEVLPMSNIADFTAAAALIEAADHPAAGLTVDIWHLERGPSTLADLARVPGRQVFCVELNDARHQQIGTLHQDTMRRRVLCGAGDFDVTGFIRTLQDSGFTGPWGVEIIADDHLARPLEQSLPEVHRTTLEQFGDLT